jgi:hypothetical protein
MPFAFAFAASAFIHIAALLGPGWALPGQDESEPLPPINAVLTRPADAPPAAKPVHKPVATKPRPTLAAVSTAGPSPASTVPVAAPVTEPVAQAAVLPVAPEPAVLALPGKGSLRYVITKGASGSGMTVGQSVHTWEHDGLRYTLHSVSETTGLAALFKPARVVQISRGEVTNNGLRPTDFRHERADGSADTASFDHVRHIVAYAGREESQGEGMQDMLSLYYQLVLMGVTPQMASVELPVATGRKLERYRFERMGEETIKLSDGSDHATVHLGAKSGNDRIEVWIAPGSRSLPIKIRYIDRNGEIFDQLLEGI